MGVGSYCLGMGRVWRSNSNLGSHPFLESVFLTCGASKSLGMHAQAIMHPFVCFLMQLEIAGAFSLAIWGFFSFLHGLAAISFTSPYPECILGVAGANGKEGAMILGFEEAVFVL